MHNNRNCFYYSVVSSEQILYYTCLKRKTSVTMNVLKYFLIGIGFISIVLFIALLIIGVKVVSTVVLYIVGALAVISLIGFIIFYAGRLSGKD